jgi:16S rRNA processing protein RimM
VCSSDLGLFRNQILYIKTANALKLAEGEYYFHELIGLSVNDEEGKALGELTEIIQTGANDVYVVTDASGGELLLPAIPDVIKDIDLVSKSIKVHILPGLLGGADLAS